jgi:acetoin utilization protein AcuB
VFVRDWMSGPAIVGPVSMDASEALALMEERKIRRLPVVEGRRLVGIVTRGDLQRSLGPYPTMWKRLALKLSDVMKTDPVAVSPDDTLESVARRMLDAKIGGIPVVEGGEPVGMITESDVFRALCKILGFGGQSARLAFTAPEEGDILKEVADRLKDREATTILAHRDERRHRWEVVLRLRGPVPAEAASRP